MDKDNPACIECSKNSNGVHNWQVHRTPDGHLLGANCINCELFVNKKWALDMGYPDVRK